MDRLRCRRDRRCRRRTILWDRYRICQRCCRRRRCRHLLILTGRSGMRLNCRRRSPSRYPSIRWDRVENSHPNRRPHRRRYLPISLGHSGMCLYCRQNDHRRYLSILWDLTGMRQRSPCNRRCPCLAQVPNSSANISTLIRKDSNTHYNFHVCVLCLRGISFLKCLKKSELGLYFDTKAYALFRGRFLSKEAGLARCNLAFRLCSNR